ncbi:hypothetical protein ACA910_019684 [Epithemia clementina (nom. ined.)]
MNEPVFRIRPSIVLFGDSITQQAFGVDGHVGWASLLAARYSRRADVLNRGFSGYNTQLAVDKLLSRVFTGPIMIPPTESGVESINRTSHALFCTVFFGANDAAMPGEKQHVPIKTYEQNLVRIIEHIQSTLGNHTPIVLLTPPPFDAEAWMKFRSLTKPGRSNEVAQSYGDVVKKVANKFGLAVVDTWILMEGGSPKKSSYLSDGLHLNEKGNRAVYEGLMSAIAKTYPHILPMEDGDGKYGTSGVPLEEDLWQKAIEDHLDSKGA